MENRSNLRAQIFSSEYITCKRVPFTFNGVALEIKQPTVDEVLKLQDRKEASSRVAHILINHAYIPGTEERIFDDGDYDQLATLPYSPQMTALQELLNTFLVGDVKEAEKN